MKYDSSIVGEKVINAAGKEGTIISVSRDGEPVGGKDPVTLRKLQDFVVADWLAKTEG